MASYTTSEIRSGLKVLLEGDPYAVVENEFVRSEEHTSELQSHVNLVCRLLLEKKKRKHQLRHLVHLRFLEPELHQQPGCFGFKPERLELLLDHFWRIDRLLEERSHKSRHPAMK